MTAEQGMPAFLPPTLSADGGITMTRTVMSITWNFERALAAGRTLLQSRSVWGMTGCQGWHKRLVLRSSLRLNHFDWTYLLLECRSFGREFADALVVHHCHLIQPDLFGYCKRHTIAHAHSQLLYQFDKVTRSLALNRPTVIVARAVETSTRAVGTAF